MIGSSIKGITEETANSLSRAFEELREAASVTAFNLKSIMSQNMIHEFSPIPEAYFGTSGLTETSANHIANIAKMRYEAIEEEIASVGFVTARVQIVGSDTTNVVKKANIKRVEDIIISLDKIAALKGFIAFLREAITTKEVLREEIKNYKSKELADLKMPTPEATITKEEVIAKMNTGDRERYLSLEARAATYGWAIHPKGILDEARREAIRCESQPTQIGQGGQFAGRDTLILQREVVLPLSDITAMMEALQAEHRKSEAELNGMKHTIEMAIRDDEEMKDAQYRAKYAEYSRKLEELRLEDEKVRLARIKELEGLRIIIPNRYKSIYESINKQN